MKYEKNSKGTYMLTLKAEELPEVGTQKSTLMLMLDTMCIGGGFTSLSNDGISWELTGDTQRWKMALLLDALGCQLNENAKDEPKWFPNGFNLWAETHCEICFEMGRRMADKGFGNGDNELENVYNSVGFQGVYKLAESLADEFERYAKPIIESGDDFDFYAEIDSFVERKI